MSGATGRHEEGGDAVGQAPTEADRPPSFHAEVMLDARRQAERRAAAEAERDRLREAVEALADSPGGDCYGVPCIWPDDLRAILAATPTPPGAEGERVTPRYTSGLTDAERETLIATFLDPYPGIALVDAVERIVADRVATAQGAGGRVCRGCRQGADPRAGGGAATR